MDLYGQNPELGLLGAVAARLACRSMIDVGAERGGFAASMLTSGVEDVYALDANPENANTLKALFGDDARVKVKALAISDSDGSAELHISSSPDGGPLPFGHTLLECEDTDEIAWRQTVTVARRSLGSLIDAGELPGKVGIVKIDTEGHDLAVVRGMGPLQADVVMVEHWTDLPHGLGPCPWTTQQMLDELAPRGFSHFVFVVHRDEFVTLKWDDGEVESGAMGNLVFIHDDVLARLLPDVLACAGALAEKAVALGQVYMHAARERLALVDELAEAAEARLRALELATAKVEEQEGELERLRSQC
jgi:FkbM family methyltransferase